MNNMFHNQIIRQWATIPDIDCLAPKWETASSVFPKDTARAIFAAVFLTALYVVAVLVALKPDVLCNVEILKVFAEFSLIHGLSRISLIGFLG